MRRRAYTLLETLIVIAIIAILMALSYPYCVKAVQMTRGTVSGSN